MDREADVRAAWDKADAEAGKRIGLGFVMGALGVGSVLIGNSNLGSNFDDCVDKTITLRNQACGQKPVAMFWIFGAALGVADLAIWSVPNKELQSALDLTRARYAELYRKGIGAAPPAPAAPEAVKPVPVPDEVIPGP